MRSRIPRLGSAGGTHSLRTKLTLTNVALLTLGIIAATAVSVMGMRYYLLDQIDTQLVKFRTSLGGSQISLREIDSLPQLGFIRDRLGGAGGRMDQPTPDSIFAAVDGRGEPLSLLGFQPTRAQRGLAAAVGDPRVLTKDAEPHDVTVHGAAYRATATRSPTADTSCSPARPTPSTRASRRPSGSTSASARCCWRCWPA